jgi:predicted secreted acid phosphatase
VCVENVQRSLALSPTLSFASVENVHPLSPSFNLIKVSSGRVRQSTDQRSTTHNRKKKLNTMEAKQRQSSALSQRLSVKLFRSVKQNKRRRIRKKKKKKKKIRL